MIDDKSAHRIESSASFHRYLPWREVIELTGMSRSTLKRAIREGEFRRFVPSSGRSTWGLTSGASGVRQTDDILSS